MICIHHYNVMQSIFTALKILCASFNHPSFPPPLEMTDLVSVFLPFAECHIFGIIQCVWPFQIDSFHSVICIQGSSMFFHGLIAPFFLGLSNIPLSGWTTVYLSIHLLKNILVASKFLQL